MIELHESISTHSDGNVKEWIKLKKGIEIVLDGNVNDKGVTYNSARTAYLSIENYTNQINPWTTSSEALIDALVEEYFHATTTRNAEMETEFRRNCLD